MSHCMLVLRVRTRKVVAVPAGGDHAGLERERHDRREHVAAVRGGVDQGLVDTTWAKRKSRSTPGAEPRLTMPTLLVSGCAPPRPSSGGGRATPWRQGVPGPASPTSAGKVRFIEKTDRATSRRA